MSHLLPISSEHSLSALSHPSCFALLFVNVWKFLLAFYLDTPLFCAQCCSTLNYRSAESQYLYDLCVLLELLCLQGDTCEAVLILGMAGDLLPIDTHPSLNTPPKDTRSTLLTHELCSQEPMNHSLKKNILSLLCTPFLWFHILCQVDKVLSVQPNTETVFFTAIMCFLIGEEMHWIDDGCFATSCKFALHCLVFRFN